MNERTMPLDEDGERGLAVAQGEPFQQVRVAELLQQVQAGALASGVVRGQQLRRHVPHPQGEGVHPFILH